MSAQGMREPVLRSGWPAPVCEWTSLVRATRYTHHGHRAEGLGGGGWTIGATRGAGHLGLTHTETQRGRLWTA